MNHYNVEQLEKIPASGAHADAGLLPTRPPLIPARFASELHKIKMQRHRQTSICVHKRRLAVAPPAWAFHVPVQVSLRASDVRIMQCIFEAVGEQSRCLLVGIMVTW